MKQYVELSTEMRQASTVWMRGGVYAQMKTTTNRSDMKEFNCRRYERMMGRRAKPKKAKAPTTLHQGHAPIETVNAPWYVVKFRKELTAAMADALLVCQDEEFRVVVESWNPTPTWPVYLDTSRVAPSGP